MNFALLRYLKSKWYVIVLSAVVCAGALFVEKKIVVPPVLRTTRVVFVNIFRVTPPVFTSVESGMEVKIREVSVGRPRGMWSVWQKFMDATVEKYDYAKYNLNWDTFTFIQKIDWLNRHLTIGELGRGVYEFALRFQNPAEPVDFDYINETGAAFLDTYVDYLVATAEKLYDTPLAIQKLDAGRFLDERDPPPVSVKQVRVKYAVIGVIIGVVFSSLALSLWYVRKKL